MGPNFAVVLRCLPIGEYITAAKQACQQLKQGQVEKLQGEVKAILKKANTPWSNITKEDIEGIEGVEEWHHQDDPDSW